MRARDRLINGAFNAITDLLFLILTLILYELLSSYLTRVTPSIVGLLHEYILLIVAFVFLAFLKGLLSGHVLVYPVILGEFVLITAIFASIPSILAVHGIAVNIKPLIYFLWSMEAVWVIYSIINQFSRTLSDP
ncbi:MAG: hypothetical protein AT718_04180 [Vulcanisaeta sp. JCHS_4]|jgi:hypothetical protein|nr:MAG: hypothetical protein AT718_04180 [Vulcanisaeta sp. JCHS_4]